MKPKTGKVTKTGKSYTAEFKERALVLAEQQGRLGRRYSAPMRSTRVPGMAVNLSGESPELLQKVEFFDKNLISSSKNGDSDFLKSSRDIFRLVQMFLDSEFERASV